MGTEFAEQLVLQQKVRCYPTVMHAARALLYLPVWPQGQTGQAGRPQPEPVELAFDALEQATLGIVFFAPQEVNDALDELMTQADRLVDQILAIRAETKPGHGGGIAEQSRPQHSAAAKAMEQTLLAYVLAARKDLHIDGNVELRPPWRSTAGR